MFFLLSVRSAQCPAGRAVDNFNFSWAFLRGCSSFWALNISYVCASCASCGSSHLGIKKHAKNDRPSRLLGKTKQPWARCLTMRPWAMCLRRCSQWPCGASKRSSGPNLLIILCLFPLGPLVVFDPWSSILFGEYAGNTSMFWHVLAPNFTPSHIIKSTGHPHHWREKSNASKVFANSRRSPRWRSQAACLCWRPPLRHVHVSMSSSGSVSLIRPGQTRTDFLDGLMFCFPVNPPEISRNGKSTGTITIHCDIMCIFSWVISSKANRSWWWWKLTPTTNDPPKSSPNSSRQGRRDSNIWLLRWMKTVTSRWAPREIWPCSCPVDSTPWICWVVDEDFPIFQREIHRLGNLSVIPSGKLT